jgi:hypothetical protein
LVNKKKLLLFLVCLLALLTSASFYAKLKTSEKKIVIRGKVIEGLTEEEKVIIRAKLREVKKRTNHLSKIKGIISVIERRVFVEVIKKGDGDYTPYSGKVRLKIKELNEKNEVIEGSIKEITTSLSKLSQGLQLGIATSKEGEIRKIYIHPDYNENPQELKYKAYEIEYLGKAY